MCGSILNPVIENVGSKILFGNWMTLDGRNLKKDYDLLWAALAARINPVAGLVRERYGLRNEADPGQPFSYWVAIELAPGSPVPAGMVKMAISPGLYLNVLKSENLPLEEAYEFIYGRWEHPKYSIDRDRPCLESYGPVGRAQERCRILAPLAERAAWPASIDDPPGFSFLNSVTGYVWSRCPSAGGLC